MMSKLNSKKNRGSRGFTVVELVIAMTIIVIVAGAAIGIINMQNTIYLRTMQTVEATNMAENAIECFRWADGDTNKFEEAFKKTFKNENVLQKVSDGNYIVEKSNMNVTIAIDGDTLLFVAEDGGKEILNESYTYTK